MQGAIIARDDLSEGTAAAFADPKRISSTLSSEDEKGEKGNWTTEAEVVDHSEIKGVVIGASLNSTSCRCGLLIAFDAVNDGRPFPEDPLAPIETQQLTFRAVLVGCALGFVVGAANVCTRVPRTNPLLTPN